MKIPNAEAASVDRRKVVDYLLNAAHPDNGGKAEFFAALAFGTSDADDLTAALRTIASGPVVRTVASAHGDKYVVDGVLTSPAGKTGVLRTVWIIDRGETTPRFVTAYPRDERQS